MLSSRRVSVTCPPGPVQSEADADEHARAVVCRNASRKEDDADADRQQSPSAERYLRLLEPQALLRRELVPLRALEPAGSAREAERRA
jgi:hypothetical protein